jgi:hypothetical protein
MGERFGEKPFDIDPTEIELSFKAAFAELDLARFSVEPTVDLNEVRDAKGRLEDALSGLPPDSRDHFRELGQEFREIERSKGEEEQ